MTSPSKRDVERSLEKLKEQTTGSGSSVVGFRTETGTYYDGDGNQLEDLSEDVIVLPPAVWREWGDSETFTPPPE